MGHARASRRCQQISGRSCFTAVHEAPSPNLLVPSRRRCGAEQRILSAPALCRHAPPFTSATSCLSALFSSAKHPPGPSREHLLGFCGPPKRRQFLLLFLYTWPATRRPCKATFYFGAPSEGGRFLNGSCMSGPMFASRTLGESGPFRGFSSWMLPFRRTCALASRRHRMLE